jgi:two-component system NarL family sensor kinase
MGVRTGVRIAWAVGAFGLLLVVLMVLFRFLNGAASRHVWDSLVITILFTAPGVLIAGRRPENPIGWLLCAVGITQGLSGVGQAYGDWLLGGDPGSWLGIVGLLVNDIAHWPLLGLVPLVILLFPDGRLPSRAWRPVVWLIGGALGLIMLAGTVGPGPIGGNPSPGTPQSPLGIAALEDIVPVVGLCCFLLLMLATVASWLAPVARLRRAQAADREQLKWLVYATFFLAVGQITLLATPLPEWVGAIGYGLFTAAITVAILRHRLLDIDVVINRTLVYATLTVLIVGLYVGSVTLLSVAFHRRTTLEISLLATAIVAVLFQPVRDRRPLEANRLLYGERQDPYTALTRLGQRLEATTLPDATLPGAAETIARALKLPYVAVELDLEGQFRRVASWGQEVDGALELPLIYQGNDLGRLVLGPRGPGETFSSADRRLLADLARQVGVAAHAVRLTADLQRSRERLVAAREEERRRLHRDLHDGLGPTLAGIAFGVQAARNLLHQDPPAAEGLLDQALIDTQDGVANIRRLVYDLRPPALDELGLVAALREQATHFGASADGHSASQMGMQVVVEAPDELPELPAAVEVAGYRIAMEGLTNVARHADATTCILRLGLNGGLEVEVVDDGQGLPAAWRPGVGLTSMRERAAELGGSCELEPLPAGGARLRARLPLPGHDLGTGAGPAGRRPPGGAQGPAGPAGQRPRC